MGDRATRALTVGAAPGREPRSRLGERSGGRQAAVPKFGYSSHDMIDEDLYPKGIWSEVVEIPPAGGLLSRAENAVSEADMLDAHTRRVNLIDWQNWRAVLPLRIHRLQSHTGGFLELCS